MITVAETGPFQKEASRLLSDGEKSDLIAYLSENPQSGVLIQNTGGFESSGGLGVVEGKAAE